MTRRQTRWLLVILVLAGGAIVLGQVLGGGGSGRHVTGRRVDAYLPAPADLAAASGAPADVMRQVQPPVSPDYAETAARSLTMGKAPLPDDRVVVTYQRGDTGAETTIALLLYDNGARAAEVDGLAGTLLPKAVGVEPQPASLAQADSARLWTGPGYTAFTFRRGGVVGFVGTTDPSGEEWLGRLSESIVQRLADLPPATATPTAR